MLNFGDSVCAGGRYSIPSFTRINITSPWRRVLLRLFSLTYPSGRPGVGLLLLRAAVGLAAAGLGWVYLSGRDGNSPWVTAACMLTLSASPLLLSGFLTPLACIVVGLGSTTAAFSPPHAATQGVTLCGLFPLLVMGMAAAAVLLGPGAYSLDARLFGRREIIIPRAPRRPEG